jgi:hypothetical protein
MRDFKDSDLIVEALRESKDLLEVSEDGLKVRRKAPVGRTDDYHNRSIYAVRICSMRLVSLGDTRPLYVLARVFFFILFFMDFRKER